MTRNIVGALEMNKIIWKISENGVTLKVSEIVREEKQAGLFKRGSVKTKEYKNALNSFSEKLLKELEAKRAMTNCEIIYFTIKEGFLPKHATEILGNLKKENRIKIEYKFSSKTRGPYVSEGNHNTELCKIQYIS